MALSLQAGVVITVRSDPRLHWGFSEGHVARSAAFHESSDEQPELIRDEWYQALHRRIESSHALKFPLDPVRLH